MTPTVERRGHRLVLRGLDHGDVRAARIPSASWSRSQQVWTAAATIGVAAAIHNTFAEPGYDADAGFAELREWARRAAEARRRRFDDDLPDVVSRTDPWDHQRQAFWFAEAQQAALLAMDMGTGKTKVAVDLATHWHARLTLVVCPKSVVGVWPREFAAHARHDWVVAAKVRGKRGGFLQSPSARQRIAAFERAIDEARLVDGVCALVVNYDAVWREPLRSWLVARDWDLVILDEAHRIKAPGGRASLFFAHLRDRARRRLCLTGTPMPHSPLDIYAQMRFLEPALFGTSAEAFRARYGQPKVLRYSEDVGPAGDLVRTPIYLTDSVGRPIVEGVKPEHAAELADRVGLITYRCRADDVLDLPEGLHVEREAQLGKPAQDVYDQLDRDLVADVDEGVVVASNALSRLLRLQQVTSGHVPVERDCSCVDRLAAESRPSWAGNSCGACGGAGVVESVEAVDDAKERLFKDVLEDLPGRRFELDGTELTPEPVIVFCRFRHDLDVVERTAAALGRTYGELSGRRRDALDDDARLRDGVEVAGVQIQSGGVGIDFTRARYAVYYSLGFSLTDYEQSLARLRRPGVDLTRPVEYFHLVCRGTVDEDVYEALRRRKDVVETVLEQMRARAREKAAA